MNPFLSLLRLLTLLAVLSGCSLQGRPPPPVDPDRLPGWAADDASGLAEALRRQCAMATPPAPWPALCPSLRAAPDLKAFIAANFRAWPLTGSNGDTRGLVTGYYEPLLTGSRQRDNPAQVPVYRRPADLVRGTPYLTRAQIETGLPLAGQELLWLDDAIDAFFLQVQGSGRVRLRDGSVAAIGFADTNGQPYRAIGAVLVERGELRREDVTTPAIKAWLRAHPESATEVLHSNPRYVFFRELPPRSDGGPPGSLGVPLEPMRSVASDPRRVPPGALLFADTTDPRTGQPMRRLLVSQDTGAAITGPVRIDLFWGFGADAEAGAGLMREPGRLWLVWPKGPAFDSTVPGR